MNSRLGIRQFNGPCLLIAIFATLFLVLAQGAEAAPSNDDFANAGTFSSLPPGDTFVGNEGATRQAGEPEHAGDSGGHSVWFSWTPQMSGTAELATCTDGELDTLLAVYTGNAVDALAPVASSDDAASSCKATDSVVQFFALAGVTYEIAVDGKGGAVGKFALRLRGRPINDDFAQAQVLEPTFGAAANGTNRFATKQSGEPNHAGDPGGGSVWFSWTPPSSGPVLIDTCGSEIDTLLGVYTGSSLDGLTPVTSNDDRPRADCNGSNRLTSEVQFDAVAGTEYRLALDGKGGATSFFQLRLSGRPANDDFAYAKPLSSAPPGFVSGTTRLATEQVGEPDHGGGSHSVWFSWTPSVSAPIQIASCSVSSFHDPTIAVYTGAAIDSLAPVASGEDGARSGCTAADAEVQFQAVAGTTYRIAVDAFAERASIFDLRFSVLSRNDDFAAAIALGPTDSAPAFGSNDLATKQAGEPDHAGDPGGHSLWYTWTPQASGPIQIMACADGEGFEPLLGLYIGPAVDHLTAVRVTARGARRCPSSGTAIEFSAVAGTTYRLALDGRGGGTGSFGLALEAAPANDDFADAEPIDLDFAFGDNVLAGKEAGEPDHADDPGGSSVWYSWTAPISTRVAITACTFEGEFEPLLGVYTGTSVSGLQPVAAGTETGQECEASGSRAGFDAVAGTTYRIAVDGVAGEEGDFELSFDLDFSSRRPGNDDFAQALSLNSSLGLPALASASNRLAGKEPGEPDHAGDPGGHSLWFSWTAPQSGTVRVSTCSAVNTIDPLLAAYTGDSLDALTLIGADDDATGPDCQPADAAVVLDAVAGTTYEIAVDGKGGSVGSFFLQIHATPSNDDFEKASRLPMSLPTEAFGTTTIATRQPGEPEHAGGPGGHSVWYSWIAPFSGSVDFSVCPEKPGFEPLIAAYAGQTVDNLTPLGAASGTSNDRCDSGGSDVSFDALAGSTYRIAIDGRNGSAGPFGLVVRGVPANDDFGDAEALSGLPVTLPGPESNRFATKQAGEANHAGDPGGSSVWFKWAAPRSGTVSIDTCGSSFDTLLAVYTGSAPASLNPVQSDDDAGGGCGAQSRLSFDAIAGVNYKIAVDGGAGAQGLVALRLFDAPANDELGQARTLSAALPKRVTGSTFLATGEPGEPDHAGEPGSHSVWFSWRPNHTREVVLDTCESDFDTLLSVYTGTAMDSLTPIAESNDAGDCAPGSSLTFTAIAGTDYKIAVDGAVADQGQVVMHLAASGPVQPPLGRGEESPPGGQSGGQSGSRPPSNEFRFVRLTLDRKRGTASLTVAAASPGTFAITGRAVRPVHATALGGGSVQIAIKPTGATVAKLARRGKVRIVASVTFTPGGGVAVTKARTLTLRRKISASR